MYFPNKCTQYAGKAAHLEVHWVALTLDREIYIFETL